MWAAVAECCYLGLIHITEPAPAASSVDSDYIYVHTKVMHLGFSQQLPVKGETHLLLNIMVLDKQQVFLDVRKYHNADFPNKVGGGCHRTLRGCMQMGLLVKTFMKWRFSLRQARQKYLRPGKAFCWGNYIQRFKTFQDLQTPRIISPNSGARIGLGRPKVELYLR